MVERIAVRAQHPRPPLGTSKPVSILLFGELLVDRFPDREVPGGAPFNVAHHLQGLAGTQGPTPILISRIGKDPLGKRLLAACEAAGLATTGIQRDALHPSGRVEVVFDAIGGPHRFVIPPDQAWDYIHADTARKLALMYRTRRLYFGTLAQRAASRRALQRLLRHSRISGFLDVNLRDPWIDVDVLRWSLTHAATVKLNEEELDYLGTLFELGGDTLRSTGERLSRVFAIRHLLVTRGKDGAWLLDAEHGRLKTDASHRAPEVVDTVGAGDAFSAVFMLGLHLGWPIGDCLNRAHHFAAAVCGLRGAVPTDHAFYQPFRLAWGLDAEVKI